MKALTTKLYVVLLASGLFGHAAACAESQTPSSSIVSAKIVEVELPPEDSTFVPHGLNDEEKLWSRGGARIGALHRSLQETIRAEFVRSGSGEPNFATDFLTVGDISDRNFSQRVTALTPLRGAGYIISRFGTYREDKSRRYYDNTHRTPDGKEWVDICWFELAPQKFGNATDFTSSNLAVYLPDHACHLRIDEYKKLVEEGSTGYKPKPTFFSRRKLGGGVTATMFDLGWSAKRVPYVPSDIDQAIRLWHGGVPKRALQLPDASGEWKMGFIDRAAQSQSFYWITENRGICIVEGISWDVARKLRIGDAGHPVAQFCGAGEKALGERRSNELRKLPPPQVGNIWP